jgi:gluconokinase
VTEPATGRSAGDQPGPGRPEDVRGADPQAGRASVRPVPAVVVMGVSGCGKTTVGALLAPLLGGTFIDGDALHPAANIEKMAAGRPLDDEDRYPWLQVIGQRLGAAAAAGEALVVGCSALKRSYRDLIRGAVPHVGFVHLHGTPELLAARMADRPGHFMPSGLLNSQLATLEPLGPDEYGRVHDLADEPDRIAQAAADWVGRAAGHSTALT